MINPIIYKGQRVMTFAIAADFFACSVANLKMNFNRNKKRFTAGEDFFKLEGKELADFKATFKESVIEVGNFRIVECEPATVFDFLTNNIKDKVTNCCPVQKNAKTLYLWTRRGILRHAKMLNTDNAWEVYFMLERAYFKVIEGEQPAIDEPALERPKTLTFNGEKVWTIEQAAVLFRVSKWRIKEEIKKKRLTRKLDFFVTTGAQLKKLREENGRWFQVPLTLIFERGMMKLRARFEEGLVEPMSRTMKALQEKVDRMMKAALEINVFLNAQHLLEV